MSLTKLPTVTKVFLALVILGLTSGVLPGQPKEGPKTITVPAMFQASETVEIYSLVTGHLAKQTADIGDKVKKGQVLAEIDAPILLKEAHHAEHALEVATLQLRVFEALVLAAEASLKETQGRIQQRDADLQAARAILELRVQELKRFKALVEQRAVDASTLNEQTEKMNAARAVVDAAQAAILQTKGDLQGKMALHDKAKAELEVQRARIRAHRAALELAQARVNQTKIIAPFDGVITRRQFSPGELIRAADHGRPLPLFVLQRMDRLRVTLQIPEKSALLVKIGTRVGLTIPALEGKIGGYSGSIARTAHVIEDGTLRVEVDVRNADGIFRPGMTATAYVHLEKAK